MTKSDHSSLVVGAVLVEPALDKISRDLKALNLRPQVMELLVFLASNAGQVVSIQELLDKLWPGKVVTDGTLYNCIGELRQAIARLDDTRPYIENIPKKGYRLAVAVGNVSAPPIDTKAEARPERRINSVTRPRRRPILDRIRSLLVLPGIIRTKDSGNDNSQAARNVFIFAVVIGLLIGVAVISYRAKSPEDISIAVLPFEDLSQGGDQAYFGKGIADELRLELRQLDGLRVAGRTSSIAYAKEDSKTIGEILNVDSIVEGSIRKEGNNVRITTQLTHAADGFTLWSKSYDRKLVNIFEVQGEIAASVAGALGMRLGVGSDKALRGADTRNVEALELYLQSQGKDHSAWGTVEAIRLLERAVELDPDYAAAWSLLGGRTLSTTWDVLPHQTAEIVGRAHKMVFRGVQLNPESATAHSMMADARHARFDWIGAEQSYLRAMELLMDRPIVTKYARALMRIGRIDYAQDQYGIATSLEPLGGRPPSLAWHASLAQGRFAEAREISDWQRPADRVENNLDIAFNEPDPEKLKTAIRAMSKTHVATVALYAPVLAEFESPERILSIARNVYLDENLQWIRKLHDIAMVAAYFGDPQFALKAKGREVRVTPNRLTALWYPVMSEARQLPEFKKLVIELDLVEYWRAYGWADACRPSGDDDFECS